MDCCLMSQSQAEVISLFVFYNKQHTSKGQLREKKSNQQPSAYRTDAHITELSRTCPSSVNYVTVHLSPRKLRLI